VVRRMTMSLRRKTVYAGTLIGMLAVVAGFAMAAGGVFGPIGGSTAQNGWTTTTTGTPWAGTVGVTPYVSSGTQSCTTTPYTASSGTPSIYITGDSAGASLRCGSAGDFYEEFLFTPTTAVPLSTQDNFLFSSNLGSTLISITTSAGATATTLTVFVDYTTTGGAQTIPTSLSVLVY
jgi:hypothetical protein